MTGIGQREALLERIHRARGGVVNWCTLHGIEDADVARAWLALSAGRKWGRGPAETDLWQQIVVSQPEQLGLDLDQRQAVELVDLGCGDGYKGGIAAAALADWGVDQLRYIAVDGSDILVRHAASIARSNVPGMYTAGVAADFRRVLDVPIQRDFRRILLLFGNTINTFEAEDIIPPLTELVEEEDLLVVGARYLRAQLDRNLPPINEATVDLDLYPAEIGTLLKGYYDFNVTFPVYKALIAGLHDSQFDHHVEFHPCDQRIRRLIYVKNIDPHSELARYGFRDGQIILFSVTRYEPLMTQAEHLTRFFDLLSIRRFEGDRPDDNNALLVLRRKA